MNQLVGMIYLALGLATTGTIVGRLYNYWDSYAVPRKTLLIGYTIVMFSFTARGIELLWFNAPGPRPAAVLAILGACACLWAFLMPEDKRLAPVSWKDSLRHQEPENYDRYISLLNQSAAIRNESTAHPERYKTTYEES